MLNNNNNLNNNKVKFYNNKVNYPSIININ